MFETLEEGIALFEEMNLNFANDSFKRFIEDLEKKGVG